MRTVGNTFVRSNDQSAVVQAVVGAFGGDASRSYPETAGLRRLLGPRRPYWMEAPASDYQTEFSRIVTRCFSDVMPAVFVSPSINGWVGIYDQSLEGVDDPQPELARVLSRELQTVAVSFWLLHDDLFRYFVAENGKLRDEYVYFPDAHDREELTLVFGRNLAGNPSLVARLCGRPAAERALGYVLGNGCLSPAQVFEGIASALEIPFWLASHQYLRDPLSFEMPEIWSEFAVVTQGQLNALPA